MIIVMMKSDWRDCLYFNYVKENGYKSINLDLIKVLVLLEIVKLF